MDPLNMILNQNNGQAVRQLAGNSGLNENQALSALSSLLPALGKGLARNASDPGGMESSLGALAGGQHERYLEDPSLPNQPETIGDGNGISGHILGSKDASRQLARRASEKTGIGTDILKKMLPMAATLAMGTLGRFLESDRDGSVVDDLLGMASRFLRK